MKIRLLLIGKTTPAYLREGVTIFSDRLHHYCDFEMITVADVKNASMLPREKLMHMEADIFLKKIRPGEKVILLDERGKQLSSTAFAAQLEKWMIVRSESITFIIGGAFGFGEKLRNRADYLLSLSSMTFSHQMIRLIFCEQLYRGFTILKREPYHHG